ncbi:MAG: hypothetical protein EZS28_023767 [Streblomastix strix]|uniref:Uncharacterized protein n=1 Tax=Streblomastix strix TaxID=222440 RepID=A0A5J4VE41_9EUKA|nr:MAG: hypothetical protein EZS28_023767 [Streblomastix strix]
MKDNVLFWSEGGPHFRNKFLILNLLNVYDLIIPRISFDINYIESYHGNGEVDGIFNVYAQGLWCNKLMVCIKSLISLIKELHFMTQQQVLWSKDPYKEHDILVL